jgi:hypothetical protein
MPANGWEAHFARLVAYKAAHGDCNVPAGRGKLVRGSAARQMGDWVKGQRKRKLKLDRGEPIRSERLVAERAARLTALGFVWDPPDRNARGLVGRHPGNRKVKFTGLTQNSQVDPAV